ncbi:4Fe-4S dicluster domain-containing protein [Microvirga yunnanensis]|uniref:4Fe-4S dicluster domain-containing protein n=1 Tax=Microvirga yunnanensis TaxID=2953740 RepID=UPI0035A1A0A8
MTDIPDPGRRRFLLGKFTAAAQAPQTPSATIGPSCLAFQGVTCMSCRDVCASGAVRLELVIGGARPRIDAETCTGCGDCSQACPADAIQMSEAEEVA